MKRPPSLTKGLTLFSGFSPVTSSIQTLLLRGRPQKAARSQGGPCGPLAQSVGGTPAVDVPGCAGCKQSQQPSQQGAGRGHSKHRIICYACRWKVHGGGGDVGGEKAEGVKEEEGRQRAREAMFGRVREGWALSTD